MSEIHVKEGESIDSALKRFKRSCAKALFYASLMYDNFILALLETLSY